MSEIRLKKFYQQKVVPQLKKSLNLDNDLAAPRLEKAVISVGVTEEQHQNEALENMSQQLQVITGQKPKITRAKKSIAGFKLRQGDPIGLMVTLRGKRMHQFVDKLFHIVLPRVKDFQGVSKTSFDHAGNYNLGLEEQIVFPEIEYGKIDKVRGLQITLVTSTKDPQAAFELLSLLGMPFAKDDTSESNN